MRNNLHPVPPTFLGSWRTGDLLFPSKFSSAAFKAEQNPCCRLQRKQPCRLEMYPWKWSKRRPESASTGHAGERRDRLDRSLSCTGGASHSVITRKTTNSYTPHAHPNTHIHPLWCHGRAFNNWVVLPQCLVLHNYCIVLHCAVLPKHSVAPWQTLLPDVSCRNEAPCQGPSLR